MLKRLGLAFAGLFAFMTVAHAAGTVPGFSLTPQFDLQGKIAPGAKLYVIQAGTVSTPQNVYQDTGLTILATNPLIADATGRIGQWFVADGSIKLRLTKSDGTQIFVQDNLLVIGASSGGGGGSPVDPTTILQTGMKIQMYGTGVLTGFVRCNGRTIGNATSGATERANADTSALFSYLYGADPNLAVSGGRGASAAADYAASKTITLPDCRGRVTAGLDDMGNSAAGRLTSSWFGATATTLGAVGGNEKNALSNTNQIPQFTPTGSVTPNAGGLNPLAVAAGSGSTAFTAGTTVANGYSIATFNTLTASFTGNAVGSASPSSFATAMPAILMTDYFKL